MKLFLPFLLLCAATALFYAGWWNSAWLYQLDNALYDRMETAAGRDARPASTVIVAIDDQSLRELGQWPWPRIVTAKLIETINEARPDAIVLDMVFAEKDRTSPVEIESFYRTFLGREVTVSGLEGPFTDNDSLLAAVMGNAPIVLPIFSNATASSRPCRLPSVFEHSGAIVSPRLPYRLESPVCSLSEFQRRTRFLGHIHAEPDRDGILRRLSLAMRYQETWIPALGIAALRPLPHSLRVGAVSPWEGGMQLHIGEHTIKADDRARALLTYYPTGSFPVVSAYDLLAGRVPSEALRGKIVFIGSTAAGLDARHTAPDGTLYPGVFLHATLTENLLQGSLKVQPWLYPPLQFALAFVASLALLMLMLGGRYLGVVLLFGTVVTLEGVATFLAWRQGIYLSPGYLAAPLAGYLFVIGLLMFLIDYRQKKRFIETLRHSENEIAYQKAMVMQQSKLAAMGEMIDHIAHQWRAPLTLLGSMVQHAHFTHERGRMDASYIRKFSEEAMEQIQFMSDTIEDFRHFVNPRNNEPNLFDVHTALLDTLRLMRSFLSPHNIAMGVEESGQTLLVKGSANEFKQVLVALLQNAKDALLQHCPSHPFITIRLEQENSSVRVILADNGGGISPDILDALFQPYVTTKQEGKGSGIGLYIADAIVREKMGGTIQAANTAEGAVFTITLPLQSAPNASS